MRRSVARLKEADFAGLARLTKLADANRIVVVMPSQTSSANASLCWNWFLPINQARGDGEPSIIITMIDAAKTVYGSTRRAHLRRRRAAAETAAAR